MAEISLESIGRRLDAIQTELREFKFAVDVDRRDAASWRNSLVTELGAKLATFELRIDNRLAQMDEKLAGLDDKLAEMETKPAMMEEKYGTFAQQLGEGLEQMAGRLTRIESLLRQLLNKYE